MWRKQKTGNAGRKTSLQNDESNEGNRNNQRKKKLKI